MRCTLILASASPRRRQLISVFGLPVEVRPASVDESAPDHWTPARTVEALSRRKAEAVVREVAASLSSAGDECHVVIGSDTVVVLDGKLMGKPADAEEARDMLRRLSGRTHEVYTGVACFRVTATDGEEDPAKAEGIPADAVRLDGVGQYRVLAEMPDGLPKIAVGHTVSRVTFAPMSDEEIEAYVGTGDPLDKAGAYGIQGAGSLFVEKIEGDFYSVMGLPVNLLYRMLSGFGIGPLLRG